MYFIFETFKKHSFTRLIHTRGLLMKSKVHKYIVTINQLQHMESEMLWINNKNKRAFQLMNYFLVFMKVMKNVTSKDEIDYSISGADPGEVRPHPPSKTNIHFFLLHMNVFAFRT
jgi:hypothetical protein